MNADQQEKVRWTGKQNRTLIMNERLNGAPGGSLL